MTGLFEVMALFGCIGWLRTFFLQHQVSGLEMRLKALEVKQRA